jgi:peptide/nickel transport system permease protein
MRTRESRKLVIAKLGSQPFLLAGVFILALFMLSAIILPFFLRDPLSTDVLIAFRPPSFSYLFGTDKFGRDIFSRCVSAARMDIAVGLSIAFSAMFFGVIIGLTAGVVGGRVDETIMRLTDLVLAFPGFVLALVLVAVIGDSVFKVGIAVTIGFIPYFVRLIRAEVLLQRELDYVDAAKLVGNGPVRLALFHILPNAIGSSVVQATLVAGWSINTVAGLAFLGVGIRPPTAEWGVMVAEGANDIATGFWWTSLAPGSLIVITSMAFHLIGDQLSEETI